MARPLTRPDLVVVGCPSLDLLLVEGRVHQAPGGAAFITALAAQAAGARVGLVARVPPFLPGQIPLVFGPGGLDRGGLLTADGALPSFRITYDAEHRATYSVVEPGMESALSAADVPEAWLSAPWLHVAAIGGDAAQQLAMATGLRARGYRGRLSAGTFRRMVAQQPEVTCALLAMSDLFFLNSEEVDILLPGGLPADHTGTLVITRGEDGVEIVGGPHPGRTPAPPATVVDATGAGDAFCGGFLAGTVTGHDPVQAGLAQAQVILGGFGAGPLLEVVARQVGPRVEVSPPTVAKVAAALAGQASDSALDFTDPPHLPAGHAHALPMLWIATLHQYGFWTADTARWTGPMFATLEGTRHKGSDYIWAAFARAARTDPSLLSADRMATEPDLFARICTADDGRCPVPDLASHASLHQAHGRSMQGGSYTRILQAVNAADRPGAALLDQLRTQPGYMGDPLRKKANLLLLVLSRRPEGFVDLRDPQSVEPIVDYHLMRGCLRTGCVRILDPDLQARLEARTWVDAPEELAIRQACGRAIQALVDQSGTSVAAVDGFFFVNGRRRCLEIEPPHCTDCALEPACARATEMFQPVFRTTAY